MKLNVLIMLVMLTGIAQLVLAQSIGTPEGVSISKFEDGKVLSQDDVNFISLILNSSGGTSRGSAVPATVMVGKSNLAKGSKLTAADAAAIEAAFSSYRENNNNMVSRTGATEPMKSRGCPWVCYYWYCDGWGNCWYVYYCC